MAEKEQEIRHEGQKGAISNDRRRIDASTALGLAIIAVAGLATWLGQPYVAIPLGVVGFATTLLRFIARFIRTEDQRRDND